MALLKAPSIPLQLRYQALVWVDRDGFFVAKTTPLEILAAGHSREEALKNLEEVVQIMVEELGKSGALETTFEEAGYMLVGDTWEPPEISISSHVTRVDG
jgi:predicted RNase H-like HicB family nuclease